MMCPPSENAGENYGCILWHVLEICIYIMNPHNGNFLHSKCRDTQLITLAIHRSLKVVSLKRVYLMLKVSLQKFKSKMKS